MFRHFLAGLLILSACSSGRGVDPWDRSVRAYSIREKPRRRPPPPPPPTRRVPPSARSAALRTVRLLPAQPPKRAPDLAISRDQLNAVLDRGPQPFMREVRLDPFFVDRKFLGFKLGRFYDGDPRFASVDLRKGDVVLTVNHLPIGRPGEFMRVWRELRGAEEIRVEYLRGAERRLLTVRINR